MRRSLPGWLTQATQSLRLRLQTAQEQLATSDYTLHPDEDFSSLQAKAADEPDHVVPWSVRAMASWSWRLIVIGIAMAVLVYALYWMQIVVVPVLVAVLIAVLLDPVNQWQLRVLRFPL
ncbi:MAG: hypothetical protein Q4Q03_03525, partial [Bowdeniella nasicola]|nr:hypothetical protein [Bowdeniella nasicola]